MKYITLSELQTRLGGRARSSLYRDVDAGRLPRPIKIGSRLYWAEADIDAAIAKLAK
jgi:prophage regulatory protein